MIFGDVRLQCCTNQGRGGGAGILAAVQGSGGRPGVLAAARGCCGTRSRLRARPLHQENSTLINNELLICEMLLQLPCLLFIVFFTYIKHFSVLVSGAASSMLHQLCHR